MIYEQILTHHTYNLPSLKLTILPLKMDGWNTFSFPFGAGAIFRCFGCQFQGVNQPPNSKGKLKCEKKWWGKPTPSNPLGWYDVPKK